jgi:CxxC motif-containing protein (DUF1111 family)
MKLTLVAMLLVAISATAVNAQTSAPAGQIITLSGFGQPLPGIELEAIFGNTTDLQIFATGQLNFKEVDSLPALGPIFNSRSCGACHFQPAIGGSGEFIQEVRVRNNTAGGPVHIFASDNILRLGPQSQGATAIFTSGLEAAPLGCQITSPGCNLSVCQTEEAKRTTFARNLAICDPTSLSFKNNANCTAERQSTPLFGFGLVEAVADESFVDIAASEPAPIQGIVKMVTEIGSSTARVGRFGWKDDHATLRGFSGDAYLNEIGITNPDHQAEVSTCALNQTSFGVLLDAVDDPEDGTDSAGRADIDRFADFMRALSPPPTIEQSSSAKNGGTLFNQMGCNGCHLPSLTTASNPASFIPPTTGGKPITTSLNSVLANQTFHPYSDFLLHRMGSLGDGITSGAAGPTMIRTMPLWGVRAKSKLLHDGRADDIPTAISLHDGQGRPAAEAFGALTPSQQQDVVNFLDTL